MDEYQLEIQHLQRQLAHLEQTDADPSLIEEYASELRNLTALYNATSATLLAGEHDERLARALHDLGFGDWTLDNVYSFVYDMSMELPLDGRELSALVEVTDYAGSLLEALDAAD
ncbi:MAG: hypothetical protein ABR498_05545 [Candidatus Dormibacteria bacterium]